jgi:recombination protein RecA
MAKKKDKVDYSQDPKSDKQAAFDAVLKQIQSEFGSGSVMKLDQAQSGKIPTIPTGALSLDIALGGNGIPKGRIIEIFGPESSGKSTLAMNIVAQVQKAGGKAVYIDAENAMDAEYATKMGINVNELVISQPDTGEQGLQILEAFVSSGTVDLIVVDSVAALVPKAEIDGEIGDQFMGLQARMMSQALRKLTGIIGRSTCSVIFINQLREKIGVMFGCSYADNILIFEDGTQHKIKDVVKNKIKGNVLSYSEKNGKFEFKKILDWHDNGNVRSTKDFIHFETSAPDTANGKWSFAVTPDHKILTDTGWKAAKDINISDNISSSYNSYLSGSFMSFLYGCLIGDSHIALRTPMSGALRLQDNTNPEYINWKVCNLEKRLGAFKKLKIFGRGYRYSSKYTHELAILKSIIPNRMPLNIFNSFDTAQQSFNMTLAIWIMDDGHYDTSNGHKRYTLSVKRFKNNKPILDKIVAQFVTVGLPCTVNYKDGTIIFNSKSSRILAEKIYKYVPPPMEYKLPESLRGNYDDTLFNFDGTVTKIPTFVPVLVKRNLSSRQFRQKGKYDITVQGNANYAVGGQGGGVVIHNSPETTPGGRALKFYSSVRIDIRRVEVLKKGEELIGNKVKAKIVKNKVAAPFREAIFDIIFGYGIHRASSTLEVAKEYGVIQQGGAWVSYKGQKIGQGRDLAVKYLEEHQDVLLQVESETKEAFRLKTAGSAPDTSADTDTDADTDDTE